MSSQTSIILGFIYNFLVAVVLLLAGFSLSGCSDDQSSKLQALPGNRDAPAAQRDMEIPPGIQKAAPKPAPTSRRPQ